MENSLTDMLVNLYNSKEQSVYEGLYIKVIQKLHWQNKNVYNTQLGQGIGQLNSKLL